MWTDVVDLRDFYTSALGRVARRMIIRRLRLIWPDVRSLSVLGLGYATPFLGAFRSQAGRLLAMMPAMQGVLHWPADAAGLTALVDETSLPLADRSVDRIVLAHALECAERTWPLMRELWRVLADDGRLIIIVPNRRGLWAHSERSPFGNGRPYSPGQLSKSLREAMFTPFQLTTALFVPPVRSRMLLSSAVAWEEIGERWFTSFAGVVMFEATKQIYAGQLRTARARAPAYLPIPSR